MVYFDGPAFLTGLAGTVWRPALEPSPQEEQLERDLPPNLEEIREDGRLRIGPGWWPILDREQKEM